MYSSNEKIVKMHGLIQKSAMLIKKECKLHMCAASKIKHGVLNFPPPFRAAH